MPTVAISHVGGLEWQPLKQRGGCRRVNGRVQLVASAHRPAASDECLASRRAVLSAGLMAGCLLSFSQGVSAASEQSLYDFSVMQYGKQRSLEEFRGQNRNYNSLRALYTKYHAQGFNLIAFPCNQFGSQAPESSDGERKIAIDKFGFEFPIMDKIEVNGKNAHPLYRFLKAGTKSGDLEWNYVKFLVDRNGHPVKRFPSLYDPADFEDDVRLLLAGKDGLPAECRRHPGRKACKVDAILGT